MTPKPKSEELTVCPDGGAKLKTIIYGMLAGDPGPDYVVGGCMIGPGAPTKACSQCEWEGGGQEFEEPESELDQLLKRLIADSE